jgi:hypothetical protein
MGPVTDDDLHDLARRLVTVPGIRAVLLGGSRARGDHAPDSDHDLGLYYEPPLDVGALRELARDVAGPTADVTEPGAWGPWVDGGAWLKVDGLDVDWIYRDLRRVRQSWSDAQAGRFGFHAQAGHPLGVPDFAYAGEVALGVVLAAPSGELAELKEATRGYPAALADAVVGALWEADFLAANARKAVSRGDTTFIAGCLFRAVSLCAHALHGRAGHWVVHEKGLVASAARLPLAPADFGARAHGVLAGVGRTPEQLGHTIAAAEQLVESTRLACSP